MTYNNKADWPEKYDINKLISRENDIDKIMKGEKITERRNDRYADVGDEIKLKGETFVIDNVYPEKLKDITDDEAKDEGFNNLEEYKKVLTSIHHGGVWEPERTVWVHEFKAK